MKVRVGNDILKAKLTTNHNVPAHNGVPILMVNGQPLGHSDIGNSQVWIVEASQSEREALVRAKYYIPDEPWGLRLARLREAAGLTQTQLARLTGMAQSHVAELESRFTAPNSLRSLEKLRRMLPRL